MALGTIRLLFPEEKLQWSEVTPPHHPETSTCIPRVWLRQPVHIPHFGTALCTSLPALLLGSYKAPLVSLRWGCAMPLALWWRFITEELLGRALELSPCISPSTQDPDVQRVSSRPLYAVRTSRTAPALVHSVTGAKKCKVRATTGPVGIRTWEKQDVAPPHGARAQCAATRQLGDAAQPQGVLSQAFTHPFPALTPRAFIDKIFIGPF